MRNAWPLGLLLLVAFTAACGFGIYADDGSPDPSPSYWGWQCADGTAPNPDAGCLPPACDDGSTPTLAADGGPACVCADGTQVLLSTCEGDGG